MSAFKCKMCGGALEIQQGDTVVQCEYCGTNQTLPKLDDEKRVNLYERANHFRRNNEFDKASAIYEKILNEDSTDAEAYWSLVLCRYGIEYVKDPTSHRRVPTVNRSQFTSVFDDDNYKSAIKNADSYQRTIYEEEAKAINEIQKCILAISEKEEPFDVFICYKETDASGRRTQDSVLAQELYYQLKQEGFKAFFSRITLEDKLGTAYEPYIFAALNSAKVMVVIGTAPEHLDSVWVKNEWSRYLSLIKNGAKKTLIPAYRDMDPYDLPQEFSHLQAQDMSKLGFMQDLVRGIRKIVGKDKKQPTPSVEQENKNNGGQNADPLLRRAFLFLEDADFDDADEYAEKVLDINPECAEAYIVKLLVERQVCKPADLAECKSPIADSPNYKKAVRFATPEYKITIEGYNDAIIKRLEDAHNSETYSRGVELMLDHRFDEALQCFQKITLYRDVAKKIEDCKNLRENARKAAIYSRALKMVSSYYATDADIKKSIELLKTISGYKDVDYTIKSLNARLEERYEERKQAAEEAKTKAEEERRTRERNAELRRIRAAERARRNKKIALIVAPIVVAIVIFIILLTSFIIPNAKYNDAIALARDGKYEEAIYIFEQLNGYKDSEEKIEAAQIAIMEETYLFALEKYEEGDFAEAKAKFTVIKDYRDSSEWIVKCDAQIKDAKYKNTYQKGLTYYSNGDYKSALTIFNYLGDYEDSKKQAQKCKDAIVAKLQQFINDSNFAEFVSFSIGISEECFSELVFSDSQKKSFYDYLTKDINTQSISSFNARIVNNEKYFNLLSDYTDAKNVLAFNSIYKKLQNDDYIKLFDENMKEISGLWETDVIRSLLTSDAVIAYYLNGEWGVKSGYSEFYLKFYHKDGTDKNTTHCNYNLPYPEVNHKYWDMQNLEFVFLDADQKVISKVYKIDFLSANKISVYCYKDSKTYVMTRDFFTEGLIFGQNNNTYYVSDYTGSNSEVIISESYKSFPVTSIDNRAFEYCTKVTDIQLPNTIVLIGEYAFSGCIGLNKITLPSGVTQISKGAFSTCSALKIVYIGNNVTKIDEAAFSGCTSLNTIIYEGTVGEWQAVQKGTNWNFNTGNYIIQCSDGTITK